ncbi:MAG: hypothetical protein ACLR3R_10720 [Clostridium paraputrificum]|uniref:hypothetical protein n=1 Tax=Clostridium TaxID=1485 RepID=UPI000C08D003|nr:MULTISPECIES: hypothetical protein [Clostridium]MDU2105746.1 hypothetical protein [Clostridium sp.]MDU3353234.1 hypothetical protein [Clostridium sp.]MDU4725991.1 hypothetical protein [Clostridium sp.]
MIKEYFKHIENILKVPILKIGMGIALFINIYFIVIKFKNLGSKEYFSTIGVFEGVINFWMLLFCTTCILFIIGMDYTNSIVDISIIAGGSKSNIYLIRKLITFLSIYIPIYFCTAINVLIGMRIDGHANIKTILIYSLITQIFVISFTLLCIGVTRSISISMTLVTFGYFIQEFLWRGKITKEYGVLAHRFFLDVGDDSFRVKVKLFYFILSIVFLWGVYKSIGRKRHI